MDCFSSKQLRLIFPAITVALLLLAVGSTFRSPHIIHTTPTSLLHDDGGGGACSRFWPWACGNTRTGDPGPKPSTHQSDVPHHPLDPLTVTEINRARQLLHSHPPFASSSSVSSPSLAVHTLALDEPDKSVVRSWRKGVDALPPRRAVAVVRFRGESYVLAVDLGDEGSVTPLPAPASGYPMMNMDEQISLCGPPPFHDPVFNATIRRRGVRMSDVACLPIAVGWYGPDEENRRLTKMQCFSTEGTANFYRASFKITMPVFCA